MRLTALWIALAGVVSQVLAGPDTLPSLPGFIIPIAPILPIIRVFFGF